MEHVLPDMLHRLEQQAEQRHHEREEERRKNPAACNDEPLYRTLDHTRSPLRQAAATPTPTGQLTPVPASPQ